MRIVHRIDSEGLYVEDVVLTSGKIPADCVEVPLPAGIFLPAKFENGEWISLKTQVEIDAIRNTPKPTAEIDEVKKTITDLSYDLMMRGVL